MAFSWNWVKYCKAHTIGCLPSPLSTLPLIHYSPAADFLYTGYIKLVPFTGPLNLLFLIAWNSVPQISASIHGGHLLIIRADLKCHFLRDASQHSRKGSLYSILLYCFTLFQFLQSTCQCLKLSDFFPHMFTICFCLLMYKHFGPVTVHIFMAISLAAASVPDQQKVHSHYVLVEWLLGSTNSCCFAFSVTGWKHGSFLHREKLLYVVPSHQLIS